MAQQRESMQIETHPLNEIRRTIAVLSGKGGVGKSLVTALLATYLARTGKYRVGILDADVTGPSIPTLFGAADFKPKGTDQGLFPVRTHSDIQLMSINLLLEDPAAPVIWRGPILANTVKQFWSEVIWGDLDFLLLDMPPGTGDIPLTVFQSLPLDGIIIVTSPQDLVSLIVQKAIHMAQMMQIPILGLVENMSHVICPHCGEQFSVFGESKTEQVARDAGIPYLGSLPIDPDLARLSDEGAIERIHKDYLGDCLAALEKVPARGLDFHMPPAPAQAQAAPIDKVALAATDGQMAEHFGHCAEFVIYDLQPDGSFSKEVVANPGHKPGFLPNFLHEKGVKTMIAGGIGSAAIEIFEEKGIKVYTGASGSVDEVFNCYKDGRLESSGTACREHAHDN